MPAVVLNVCAGIETESINFNVVVSVPVVVNKYNAVAVTVARGIAVIEVTNDPSAPAVNNNTAVETESPETTEVAAVMLQFDVFTVCANGAVNVFAMLNSCIC